MSIESFVNKHTGFNTDGLDPHTNKGIFIGPDGERYFHKTGLIHAFKETFMEFSIDEYRGKFCILTFITIPKGILALGHRIGDLLRLGSFQRALLYSKISSEKLNFSQLNHPDKNTSQLGLKVLLHYTYNFIAHPIKDIVKISTFPIHVISLNIISLLGIILPKQGRFLFSKVQKLWEYDNILERENFAKGIKPRKINSSFVYYLAPCMPSLEDFNRLNLYLHLPDSNHRELRSLHLRLKHLANRYQDLLSENVRTRLDDKLDSLKTSIKRVYPHGGWETDANGQLKEDGREVYREQIEEAIRQLEQGVATPAEYNEEQLLQAIDQIG